MGIAVQDRDPRNPAHSRKRVEGCLNLYRPHHEPLMKAASSTAFGATRACLDVITALPMGDIGRAEPASTLSGAPRHIGDIQLSPRAFSQTPVRRTSVAG